MHGNAKDLTGQRFGRLIALSPTNRKYNSNIVWKCKCDCGKIIYIGVGQLTKGNTRSCGCLLKEKGTEKLRKWHIGNPNAKGNPNTNIRENHPAWKGGEMKHKGYVFIKKPEHPNCDKRGYIKRCELVMEENTGRYLRKDKAKPYEGELVHHEDGDTENDDIDNLRLFENIGQHTKYHWAKRKANGVQSQLRF